MLLYTAYGTSGELTAGAMTDRAARRLFVTRAKKSASRKSFREGRSDPAGGGYRSGRSRAFSGVRRRIYRHWRVARIAGQFVRRSPVHSGVPSFSRMQRTFAHNSFPGTYIYRKFVVRATTSSSSFYFSLFLSLSLASYVPLTTISR